MQITFDPSNEQDLTYLNLYLLALAQAKMQNAQPEVAQNTGSTATGPTLSPEGSGVSGAVAEAAAPAPVKEKKTKKSAPVAAEQDTSASEQPAAPATEQAKPTIDTVRAALQAFTASKGVPAGIELLQKFGAGRISELAEEHYTAFIEGCAA